MPTGPYSPRHAALPGTLQPAAAAALLAREERALGLPPEVKAPGLAAMFRRHPRRTRRAAIATIGVAVSVFIASTVAGASPRAHHPADAAKTAPLGPAARPAQTGGAAGNVTAARAISAVSARPAASAAKAPTTAAVISGLAANGIPNVALNAYRVAAARMAHVQPSCGIDWALLAGIGREESDHGRFAGARLNPDGTSTPRIIGPALNGVGNQYIPAPANGFALDGDSTYTHALGPMQFIPQTWAAYGVDANGDGRADIFNINDAALAAARYLCANGGNLRTVAGQVRAVLAYNHSDQYVAQVLALAAAYRTGVPVTGIPVGNLYGALPPIAPVTVTYGVNPGVPTAVIGTPAAAGSHRGSKSGSGSGSTSGSRSGSGSGSGPKPGGQPSSPPAPSSTSVPTATPTVPAPAPSSSSVSNGPLPTTVPTKLPTPTPTLPAPPKPSATSTCTVDLVGNCVLH